jgi:hypothetical protein
VKKTAVSSFDPYHRWLGIPQNEQPPHHYRLLGVGLFEDDPDVIESAADRQMAHVRKFQRGPHSIESQRLLNELAAAKGCLLDAERKPDYDHRLRRRLENKGELRAPARAVAMRAAVALAPSPPAPPVIAAEATAAVQAPVQASASPMMATVEGRRRPVVGRRRGNSAMLAVMLGVVTLALTVAMVMLLVNKFA